MDPNTDLNTENIENNDIIEISDDDQEQLNIPVSKLVPTDINYVEFLQHVLTASKIPPLNPDAIARYDHRTRGRRKNISKPNLTYPTSLGIDGIKYWNPTISCAGYTFTITNLVFASRETVTKGCSPAQKPKKYDSFIRRISYTI